jgi:glutamine synthetase
MANLTMDELKTLVDGDQLDTVLTVFPDHYGRLMGKRLTARYFLEHQHFYCCDYLLSTSMEMDPRPGFEMASWEQGYGDLVYVPHLGTLRRIPWLPKTALVMCDLFSEKGEAVVQSPRTILRQQCNRLAERGMKSYMGSELEFHLFRGTFSELSKRRYQDLEPSSPYRIDYHILATSFEEPLIRAIRNGMTGAGVPIECSKGECSNGQHEIGLYYAEALEMADRHAIYKNGAKEIAALNGAALTFMAKYSDAEAGSGLHIHSSLFDTAAESNLFWDENAGQPSDTYRHFLGGLLQLCREFFLFYAPTVNSYKRFCAESFAPTRIAWGYENRTTGIRIVGHEQSFRLENRLPGADANPYLAFAATIAAGLYGIENAIEPPEEYVGNAYTATELLRVPDSLTEAADLFDRSAIARSAFGDPVVDHYVQCARLEHESFQRAVTDWELVRYFERI